jgi:hypothetical protein
VLVSLLLVLFRSVAFSSNGQEKMSEIVKGTCEMIWNISEMICPQNRGAELYDCDACESVAFTDLHELHKRKHVEIKYIYI